MYALGTPTNVTSSGSRLALEDSPRPDVLDVVDLCGAPTRDGHVVRGRSVRASCNDSSSPSRHSRQWRAGTQMRDTHVSSGRTWACSRDVLVHHSRHVDAGSPTQSGESFGK